MNDLVKALIEGLIDENDLPNKKEVIGMFGGGFKPPTVGHLEVVKRALNENPEIDKMIILVGSGVRDSISQEESIAIWNIYKKYLGSKVEIIPSPPGKAPIGDIYSYAKKNPNKDIYWFIGAREGNEDDFQDIEKRTRSLRKLVYQNVKVKPIVTAGAVSGTKARQALLAGNKEEFIQFLPDIPEIGQIWDMLSDIMAERISFKPEFTKDEVEFIEDEVDSEMQPEIDIDLSSNHFFDRLNDPRNYPDIEPFEIENFFDKLADKKEKFIEFLKKYKEVVAKDKETNINIPFMKIANKAIAKTVMRKKNFLSSTPILPLQEGRYDQEVLNQSRYLINLFKADFGEKVKGEIEGYLKGGDPIWDKEIGANYIIKYKFTPDEDLAIEGMPFIIDAEADRKELIISISYDPNVFPANYNDLIAELKDTLRHELEHVGQYQLSKSVNPKSSPEKYNYFQYFTFDFEVPAFVRGLYKKAKTKKITFTKAMNDFLDYFEENLSDAQIKKVKETWTNYAKENLPAVQLDENSKVKDPYGINAYARELALGLEEGDTYEKMAAKGKKAGSLKQGTVRKRLGIPKDKKIPLSLIKKEIARLKKMDKDPDKKGAQLGDKNQKYYKALQLAKTLKTTTNVNEAKSTHTVIAKGIVFEPKNLSINVGDTVKWINKEGVHNVNGNDENNPEKFGNKVGSGWTYSFTFTKPGTYKYHCDPHKSAGMGGVIKVKDKVDEGDPKKGTGKKPKGSGRRLYTDEDPSDTVGIKFSTRQDIVDTLSKASFKNKSHARQSQIINLIHQRVRAALNRTKDPKKKKRLQTAFNYIKNRKEASKAKTKRLQAQKKKKKANEIKGGFGKGNVGTRYRAIYKKGDKFYYDQEDALGQGIRQTFGPFKTKEAAKKKMQSFTPAINYRDITENVAPNHNQKSAPYGSGYKPLKEDLMPSILSLTQYMNNNGLNLKPYPKLKFIDDNKENAENILGRTAYYDPNQQLVALYTMNRHPKDILRSYAHELIHHHQNLSNTLNHSNTTNTNEDDALDKIEREAYENGNIMFRNWEDSIKNEN